MKVGQTLYINSSGSRGSIAAINKSTSVICVVWTDHGEYSRTITYGLSHLEDLIKIGTLKVYDELPSKNPNLLFKEKKL